MRNLAAGLLLVCAPLAAIAQEITIAALGDSLTQGYSLPPQDGFVPQLEKWLSARGHDDIALLNAGVSGDTTAGGLARIGWTLTPEVDALIVTLGGNDALRGIPPETARANLDAILTTADEHGLPVLLIGIPVPNNYGRDYSSAFSSIYPDLATAHDTLLVANFFGAIVAQDDGSGAARRRYMQNDGIHPTAEGVALIVDAIGPKVVDLADRARE